jgi:hypothetical protein
MILHLLILAFFLLLHLGVLFESLSDHFWFFPLFEFPGSHGYW